MSTPLLTGYDLGSPRMAGNTVQSPGVIRIRAGGRDFWETGDEGHFAYCRVRGDFEVEVRLESMDMADVYTKAGIMLRSSLDAGSEHALLLSFGDNQARNKNNGGIEFQYRASPNGPCTGIYPPQPLPGKPDFPASHPDLWLRLSRAGDSLTARVSGDGGQWRTFCVHTQRFPESAYLGLAATSHNADRAVDCVFSHLNLRGNAS